MCDFTFIDKNDITLPNEEEILEELNSLSNYPGYVTPSWLLMELNEYFKDADPKPNAEDFNMRDTCLKTLRKYRQKILFDLLSVWYFQNTKSSLILTKIMKILNEDQKYHTVLMIDEFDGNTLPTLDMLKDNSHLLRPEKNDKVSLLLSLNSISVPEQKSELKEEKLEDLLYCHLPTKYRICYERV